MKIYPASAGNRTRGSVAVEMAIILPIFLLILAVPFFYARVFWYYSMGQKAAHDAARYLSSASQAEMRTPGGGFSEAEVAAIARWIAEEEVKEILPSTDGVLVNVQCDANVCGLALPSIVRVSVQIGLHDNIFDSLTSGYMGSTDRTLNSDVTMRYIGE